MQHHEKLWSSRETIRMGHPLELKVVYYPETVLPCSSPEGYAVRSGTRKFTFRNVGSEPLEVHFPALAVYYSCQRTIFNDAQATWPSFATKSAVITLPPNGTHVFEDKSGSIGSMTDSDWCFVFGYGNDATPKVSEDVDKKQVKTYVGSVVGRGRNDENTKARVIELTRH